MNNILAYSQIKDFYRNLAIDKDLSLSCQNYQIAKMVANKIKKRFANPNLSFFIITRNDSNKYGLDITNELNSFYKNVTIYNNDSIDKFYDLMNNHYDIIIDCFLPVETIKLTKNEIEILKCLNNYHAFKISIDLPSGIIEKNGIALDNAFKCDLCYAINFYRYGHFFNDGMDYYKELELVKVFDTSSVKSSIKLLTDNDFKNKLDNRKHHSNKGSYGRCVIISGCKETPGAALLSSNAYAALKVGIGYSTICIPKSLYPIYALKNPENIYYLLDDNAGHVKFNKNQLIPLLDYDVITIGMGLSNSEDTYKLVEFFLNNYDKTLILDADALNALALHDLDILSNSKCKVILTPHLKEFSRLLKCDLKDIEKSPVELANEFVNKYHVTLLLKSHVNLIVSLNNTYLVNNGSPCLAKAGSGDVLSGIITGLCGYLKYDLDFIVAISCYIQGLASNKITKKSCEDSITATDIINEIPKVMNKLKRKE